ncbi:hypothetical protein [Mycoplasma procyoni]|uniref:hypothetical protein n=1 Tax=Mycoplasma procyoni TaxID=568784 RepID=UPI00197C1FDA|nr:hypothetical protein [Mycoplasma procyoni]MBN3534764.1 hypothetical protein [Mycoplasma procyoni]
MFKILYYTDEYGIKRPLAYKDMQPKAIIKKYAKEELQNEINLEFLDENKGILFYISDIEFEEKLSTLKKNQIDNLIVFYIPYLNNELKELDKYDKFFMHFWILKQVANNMITNYDYKKSVDYIENFDKKEIQKVREIYDIYANEIIYKNYLKYKWTIQDKWYIDFEKTIETNKNIKLDVWDLD